jgi:valyl-tRNA synthetase
MLINEEWPKVDKKLIFKEETETMKLLQSIIGQIRSARAELKVEPIKKIHATIYGQKNSKALESQREALMRLGRLETLKIEEKGPKIEHAKGIFIKDIEIYLPLKDLINPKKEINKLKKEIEQKENFSKGLEAKLKNKGFLQNAPADLIKDQKARSKTEKENIDKLLAQVKELEKLLK